MKAADIFMMSGSTPSVSGIFAAALSPEMSAAPAGTGNFNVMLSDILFTGKALDVSKGLLSDSTAGQADSVESVKKPDQTLEIQLDQQIQQIGAAVVMAAVQPVLTSEVTAEPVQVIAADPVAVVVKPAAGMGRAGLNVLPEKQTASIQSASAEAVQTAEEIKPAANSQSAQPNVTSVQPRFEQPAQPVETVRPDEAAKPLETAVKEVKQEVVHPSSRPAAQTITAEVPLERGVQPRFEQPAQPVETARPGEAAKSVETAVKEVKQEVAVPPDRPAIQGEARPQELAAVSQMQLVVKRVESTEPAMQSVRPEQIEKQVSSGTELSGEPVQKSEQISVAASGSGQPGKNSTAWWSYQQSGSERGNQHGQQEVAQQQPEKLKDSSKPESPAGSVQLTATSVAAIKPLVQSDETVVPSATAVDHSKMAAMAVQQPVSSSELTEVEKSVTRLERGAVPEQVTRQVAERIENHQFRQGRDQLSLTLNPESLGKIQMNFQLDQQNLRIEIVAENRTVRDALLQQADLVKDALSRQNISLTGFDISTSGERTSQQQYQQPQRQGGLYFSQEGQSGKTAGHFAGDAATSAEYQPEDSYRYFDNQYQSTFAYRA